MDEPKDSLVLSSDRFKNRIDLLRCQRMVCAGFFSSSLLTHIILFIMLCSSVGDFDWYIPLQICILFETVFLAAVLSFHFEIKHEEFKNRVKRKLTKEK